MLPDYILHILPQDTYSPRGTSKSRSSMCKIPIEKFSASDDKAGDQDEDLKLESRALHENTLSCQIEDECGKTWICYNWTGSSLYTRAIRLMVKLAY
jgi:hypothetical protein